jgi:hypothetical protein
LDFAGSFVKWLTSDKRKNAQGLTAVEHALLQEELKRLGDAQGRGLTTPKEIRIRYPGARSWQAYDGLFYPYGWREEDWVPNILEQLVFSAEAESRDMGGPQWISPPPDDSPFRMYVWKAAIAAKAKKKKQAAIALAAVVAALTAATVGVRQVRDNAESSTVETAAAAQDPAGAQPVDPAVDVAGGDETGGSGGESDDDLFEPEQADLETNPADTSTTIVFTATDVEGDDTDAITITDVEETTTTTPTTNTTPATTTTVATTTAAPTTTDAITITDVEETTTTTPTTNTTPATTTTVATTTAAPTTTVATTTTVTTTTTPTTNTTPATTTTVATTTAAPTTTVATTTTVTTTTVAPVEAYAHAQGGPTLCPEYALANQLTRTFIIRDRGTGDDLVDLYNGASATLTLTGGSGRNEQSNATVSGATVTFVWTFSPLLETRTSENLVPNLQVSGTSMGVSVNSIGFLQGNCTYP